MAKSEVPRAAAVPAAPADPALDEVFDGAGLYALRSAVAAHAADLGAGYLTDDLVIVAHELASNAVRHGGGRGRLWLWRDGRAFHCRIADDGPGIGDPLGVRTRRPAPTVPGGRGLWVVRQIASRFDLHTGPARVAGAPA